MVKIRQNLVSPSIAPKVTSGKGNKKLFLVIHETDNTNKGANADAHGRLQANGNSRQASWHFSIDDKEIVQSFSEDYICWHSGTSKYNKEGIGLEICVNSDGNYKKAIERTVQLVKHLMKKHNIPLSRVIKHQDSSGKLCPRNLITGAKGVTWNQFKSMISNSSSSSTPTSSRSYLMIGDTGEDVRSYQEKLKRLGYKIDVDGSFGNGMLAIIKQFQKDHNLEIDGFLGKVSQTKINELINNKKGELTMSQYEELKNEIQELKKQLGSDRAVSPTFKDSWKWAEEKGLMDGSNPSRPISREQFAIVLNRYNESNSLSPTTKKDLKELFENLYEDKLFLENHADKVDSMPEYEIVNKLASVLNRFYKDYREEK